MAEPDDMILPLLREMRAEIAAGRAENIERFDLMDRRVQKMEGQLESFRHALTADTLMSKLVTGEFEERIDALEKKVRELESHR